MSAFSIRKSTSVTALLVQALDFLAVCAAGWIAFQIRHQTEGGWRPLSGSETALIMSVGMFATLFLGSVYRMWPGGSLASMIGRVSFGWLVTWMLLIVLVTLTQSADSLSRVWLVAWLFFGSAALCLARVCAFFIMSRMRNAGYQHKSVILCGDSNMLQTVRTRIEKATWSGYDIVGSVSIGDGTNIEALDAKLKPDEIWISVGMFNQVYLEDLMHALRYSVANIRLLPDLMTYQILNHGMTITVGIPMVDISVSPLFGGRMIVKYVLDLLVASLALLLLSPLLLLIAMAIKLSSSGPVLFKQKRHGWNEEEIWVYKFRSMAVHQETTGTVTQAQRNDPRVTPLGRLLRKTSLDELPQFINVLQGRMSVVGPRPHALKHNSEYMKLIPKYALRHKVKPGITGWAQICGHRGETDTLEKMAERIRHDIYYLENWSLWMDIKIIFLTPFAIIQNKNVY